MYLGVDYYPEQWNINMIDEDLANIVELGADTIRIGEFAWTLIEKNEGEYNFDFFDMVIEKAKSKNLRIVMGTPTATLPSWAANKYKDTLSEFEGGKKRVFGGRRQYCFNSENYKRLTEKIVTALANHYKDEKSIIAWQIDNEFGHEGSDMCYCENCKKAFREYLKEIFDNSIDKLNEELGTVFWNQTYGNFNEIPVPESTITTHNPGLRMMWENFRSYSVEKYCRLQYDILKNIIGDKITIIHDFSGGFFEKHIDFSKVAKHIDMVAYNNYPVWGGQKEPVPAYETACALDYMRGLKEQNFWITEAIMGAQGHDVIGYLPRPWQAVMWSYQAMAHGCESLFYFRYRGFTKGVEQFCYGILDQDNVKRRKFYEVQKFFKDIREIEHVIESEIKSDVAIIYDYQSMASFRIQRQSSLFEYKEEVYRMYKPFFNNSVTVDVISSDKDFSKYKIICMPAMIVYDEEFQTKVKEFVNSGGIAIFGFRTAVKDKFNNLKLGEFNPTYYNELIGGRIEEIEPLQEEQNPEIIGLGKYEGIKGVSSVFRDMMKLDRGKSLFNYNDKFYKEYAAVSVNDYGMGKAYYLGTGLEDNIMELILEDIMKDSNIKMEKSPSDLEIVKRENTIFYINHSDRDILYKNIKIGPYQVFVVKEGE